MCSPPHLSLTVDSIGPLGPFLFFFSLGHSPRSFLSSGNHPRSSAITRKPFFLAHHRKFFSSNAYIPLFFFPFAFFLLLITFFILSFPSLTSDRPHTFTHFRLFTHFFSLNQRIHSSLILILIFLLFFFFFIMSSSSNPNPPATNPSAAPSSGAAASSLP